MGIGGIAKASPRLWSKTVYYTPCPCPPESHSTLTTRRIYRPQSRQYLLDLREVATSLQTLRCQLIRLVASVTFPLYLLSLEVPPRPSCFRLIDFGDGHAFNDSTRTTRFDTLPESLSESPSQLLPTRPCHFRSRFQGQQISLPLSQLKTNKRTFHDSYSG